ncbi:MAG: FKBP-type peptidyl-prolyl cis-trans isomerase [Bacteroidales bacterium]|nr:FKBP-type peptidyl-prolyl cis-trans isomerase [Bacteroidales bacterium]
MKNIITFVLFFLFLTSCSSEINSNFSVLPSGVQYRYVQIGSDTITANSGDAWVLDVKYFDSLDSLMFDSQEVTDKFTMECRPDTLTGCIEEGLKMMHKGDSMIFRVDAIKFYNLSRGIDVPNYIKKGDSITFYVRCKDIIPQQTLEKQFGEYIQKMMANEQMVIHDYIDREQISSLPSPTGLYKVVLQRGTGNSTAKDKFVTVHYIGTFVEGTEFDNSYKRNKPLSFQLGQDYVIPGWEEAIASMKKGEISRFVIPSNLAYGPEGTKGIPPFSTLIFDIELIDFK